VKRLDSSGRLSRAEISTLLREGRPDFPERLLSGLLAHVGWGQDGKVSFDDFVDMVFQTGRKQEAPKVLIVADPGPDPDDVKVLLVASTLQRRGEISICGVVANGGHQAHQRAVLAKAILRAAGAGEVRVGVGSAGKFYEPKPHEYRFDGCANVREEDLEDGAALIRNVLNEAEPRSIIVQCQSGLTDIADVMREEKDLFLAKVAKVSVQGGLNPSDDPSKGAWVPDSSANNVFDMEAADFLYNFCIRHQMTMHVVHGNAVPPLPMTLARSFTQKGCPAMEYLNDAQRMGLIGLWQNVCKGGIMPARCTKEWFFTTFCGVDAATYAEKYRDLDIDCNIEEHLNGSVKPYDLIAFLSILPTWRSTFPFERAKVNVNGGEHFFFLTKELALDSKVVFDFLSQIFAEVVEFHSSACRL